MTSKSAVELTKKHGGKTMSAATVLFMFGLVFNSLDKIDAKMEGMTTKINDNHIELIKGIQNVRQEAANDKMNYFGVINGLFQDIKHAQGDK